MQPITVGIPRGMLYYRYETLWRAFFDQLGVRAVLSPATTHALMEDGMAVTIDEACLSLKIYLGHVRALLGQCDYIFVPRICNFGRGREFCARFEALYDIACNVFRDSGQRFVSVNVDEIAHRDEESAYIALGQTLGAEHKAAKRAYAAAEKEARRQWKEAVKAQNALYEQEGLKILIAGHSYVIADPYIGRPITDALKKSGAIPLRADLVDREAALKRSGELSPTCKWELNREILGGVRMNFDRVDGVILLSTFPCGPDAMVNELMLRRLEGKPMLQLVLDGQSGTAGVETRLESFLDIIRFKRGLL